MKLRVAWIQSKPGKDKSSAIQQLTADYLKRIARYTPVETHELASEGVLAKLAPKAFFIALDSRGKQMSSEELAEFILEHQNRGTQQILFVVGGADGFSPDTLRHANLKLSLGKMTLPHELARVVLLEQLYRAFTILKGHPYHTGH